MLDNEWNSDIIIDGKRWLYANTFCELTGTSIDNVYVMNNKGHKYIRTVNNKVYVDYYSLLKRREFYGKVVKQCEENYFAITEHISKNKLAKILNRYSLKPRSSQSFNQFMTKTLFSLYWMDKSLLCYEVPELMWQFFRITTFLIRKIERLYDDK